MALAVGSRLGSYEVVGLLGAGGMGEVYRAVDTRLDRQVAIKVLPEAVRADPERTARFEREAKLLASLNHPNIAGIYGLERGNDEQFIVMELVEGETLADQIARGAIPVPEALQIAKQIADALEAAHESGVIHRDLKPANIKVRPDGTVKVLDFGLAKALSGDPLTSPAGLTNSPTITSPVGVTGVGTLLGTAAYMSPEQAKGKAADKRSDVWAFGALLYEMLSGRSPRC
jgi:serine/threonine protein kinase